MVVKHCIGLDAYKHRLLLSFKQNNHTRSPIFSEGNLSFFDCRKHGSGLGVKAVVSVTWFCFCFSDKGTSWRCLRLSFLMTVKLFIVIQWFLFIVTQRMCSLDRYYITCTVYFSLSRVSPGYLFVKELKSCTSKRVSTFSENKLIHFSVIDEKQKNYNRCLWRMWLCP